MTVAAAEEEAFSTERLLSVCMHEERVRGQKRLSRARVPPAALRSVPKVTAVAALALVPAAVGLPLLDATMDS